MSKNDERFLMKVVDMYYKEEMPQEKIAKQLNVSRTTISRALTKAKKEGYVKIIIDFPAENSIDLEKKLEQKYGLKEVIAVNTKNKEEIDFLVAREASSYLARVIKSNTVLGITWGYTLKKMVDSFDSEHVGNQMKVNNVEVVPLLGTMMPDTAKQDELRFGYSSLLSSKLAEAMHGISYNLPAPMYVRNPEIKQMFLHEPQISQTLKRARQCDIGVFGIGTLSERSSIASLDYEKKDMIFRLAKQGGIGEVAGRIYKEDGQLLESDLNDRIIGIDLDEIKKIPTRIGIAYGEEKVKAIRTAIATGIINVLVTDCFTAEQI